MYQDWAWTITNVAIFVTQLTREKKPPTLDDIHSWNDSYCGNQFSFARTLNENHARRQPHQTQSRPNEVVNMDCGCHNYCVCMCPFVCGDICIDTSVTPVWKMKKRGDKFMFARACNKWWQTHTIWRERWDHFVFL